MDASTLRLMDDLDHVSADVQPTDSVSMRNLSRKRAELGLVSVSYGLERSISNTVERNLTAREMDVFEVRKKENDQTVDYVENHLSSRLFPPLYLRVKIVFG